MNNRLEAVLSVTLVLSAVAASATLVHREFITPPATSAQSHSVYLQNWKDLRALSTSIAGDSTASTQIMVFADFHCPFCKSFHRVIEAYQAKSAGTVSISFFQFPLGGHTFAKTAALAAECSKGEQRFRQMADVLFDKQDSIGTKSWLSFAREAGVKNEVGFEECLSDSTASQQLDALVDAAKKVGVQGTPTIVINGWKLPGVPAADSLDMVIGVLKKRKIPAKA